MSVLLSSPHLTARRGGSLLATAITLCVVLTVSAAFARPARADERVRYAWETASLSYESYAERKAGFKNAGCLHAVPYRSATERCTKPAPYDQFDWDTDRCSVSVISAAYNLLFTGPCALHDFGYRNLGNGLSLDRSESARRRIDDHLWDEAQRVCRQTFPKRRAAGAKQECYTASDSMRAFFRHSPILKENWSKPCKPGKCWQPQSAPSPVAPPAPSIQPSPQPTAEAPAVQAPAPADQAPAPLPSPVAPVAAPPVSSQPVPPQQTWSETAGGVAHTWSNASNAGGVEGATIASHQTVQVACKLSGFPVADGNTWWYRIAQGPWNGQFYVSADAFYNNGATGGSLTGTPLVDLAVPNC